MSQFRISTQAAKDIENIWKYVAQNNPKAADKLFDTLKKMMFYSMGQVLVRSDDVQHIFMNKKPYQIQK